MKLTQWHDGDVKPVHEGVYERKYLLFGTVYCLYKNGQWRMKQETIADAAAMDITSDCTHPQWRGLATKPRSQP